MKTIIGFVVALGLLIGLATPSFASECTGLMAQIDEKISSVELPDDKAQQVEELRAKGEAAHEEGKHDEASQLLKTALGILGN